MTDNEPLDPCPADVILDYSHVTKEMGDYLALDEGWHWDLEHNELSWLLEGFDEFGLGVVTVMHKRTGQAVAGARVHWRALVAG